MSAPVTESDAGGEDLLEKMLKEAEMLAAKMTVPSSKEDESSSPAVVTPTAASAASPASDPMDPLLDKAERMVRAMREATDGGSGSIHTSADTVSLLLKRLDEPSKKMEKEDEGDGDEVLRQAQPVLQKKPSGSIDSPLGSSSKEDAPTSVYVLHHNSVADDFSSVGSSSLKAPSLSGDNRTSVNDAINASLSMADALKEIQSAGSRSPPHQPGTPPPSAPDDDDEEDDEVSVKDYTSVSSSSENKKKMLVMAAKLEAGIPDFKATSPDAKWEKVSSAERGDDDYASIQDYTTEKPKKQLVQTRVEAPVKQSRLRAYRVQARRRRRRQRLLLAAAIVVAVLYYFVFGFGSGTSEETNNEAAAPISIENGDAETYENDAELNSNLSDEITEAGLDEIDFDIEGDNDEDEIGGEDDVEEVDFSDLNYWSEEDDQTLDDESEEENGEDTTSSEDLEVKMNIGATTQTEWHAQNFMVTTESGRRISCQNPLNRFFRKPCRILFKELRLAKRSGVVVDRE